MPRELLLGLLPDIVEVCVLIRSVHNGYNDFENQTEKQGEVPELETFQVPKIWQEEEKLRTLPT